MAPPERQPPIRSPLLGAMNNIVNIKRSSYQIRSTKNSLDDFMRFMNVEVQSLQAQKLPDEKKISKLSNLNMATTFGRPGSLLSALASGAMDVAGFLGEFFRGKKKPGPGIKGGKPIPKAKGIRLGGLKAVGIANAVFAGLDFATGLAEGESVGKAAAGAGGALAGSLLGGVIGQSLIPVPGLGFAIGSMAGNFLGGWLGDRAHEAATGGEQSVKEKTDQRLSELEAKQKSSASESVSKITFPEVLDKFDNVVYQFEKFAYEGFAGAMNAMAAATGQEQNLEWGADYPDDQQGSGKEYGTGTLETVTAEGGKKPSSVTKTSGFGFRWGRNHNGNDYAGQGVDHQPISVIQPGKVGHAGPLGTAGNAVVIDHPDGSTSKYFHLADGSIKVAKGQDIVPGQVIGTVGNTGRSTGTHLHFEIWRNGRATDPSAEADNYFRFGGNVKVTPKATAAGQSVSGAPVVVLAAGTNDYTGDPKTAAAYIKRTIKDLQTKGYQVVYVPPSDQGAYAKVSAAMTEAATQQGATIEKAKYDPNDPTRAYTHISPGSEVDRIRNKYKGATFMGDSNAVRLAGGPDVSGTRVTGASVRDIEGFARNLGPRSTGTPQKMSAVDVKPVAQQPVAPQQVARYPEYNLPTQSSTVVVMPSINPGSGSKRAPVMSSPSSSGGGSQISPGQSTNQVLNSLFTTALLTNLSGT